MKKVSRKSKAGLRSNKGMTQSINPQKSDGLGDIWLAASLVFFLGLGAFATYYLTAPPKKLASAMAGPDPFKGTSFDEELVTEDVMTVGTIRDQIVPAPETKAEEPGDLIKTNAIPDKPAKEPGYKAIGFDLLASFFYDDPNANEFLKMQIGPKDDGPVIPTPVTVLSGKSISIKGFMIPIKVSNGSVKIFLLVKDLASCCFGKMPQMNHWIFVKMKEGVTAEYYKDVPITIYGILDVGEEKKKGIVTSIYRMEADRMEGPLDL